MAQHGYLPEYDDASDRGRDGDRWRGEGREHDRNFMLGEWEHGRDRFRQEDRQYRGTHENQWRTSERSDQERSPRDFRSMMDDHYRSWRDKQIQALDQDYQEYCREREQEFHSDFDEWRRRKQGNPQPLRTGMTQTGLSSDPSGELQLREDQQAPSSGGSDPVATATLGNEGGADR